MLSKKDLSMAAAILLMGMQAVHAQNETDALRYSDILPGGTARSWALGGAIGAVGADPGSASTNPAGLALYNTSEFSFTPQFEVNGAQSLYYGNSATDSDNRFSFNNLSLILSSPNRDDSNWKSSSYGISFDRHASYHWDQRAIGKDIPSTILEGFVREANGTSPGSLTDIFPFTSDLAYWTYGINPVDDTVAYTYESAVPMGTAMDQDHRINSSGRLNTTSFFYAANYMDRLYIGATLGLVGVRYESSMVHKETVLDPNEPLNTLTYTEKLLTTGRGVDLKFGILGRVGSGLRLGCAFHTPQWLQLTDGYVHSMATRFRTPDADGKTEYYEASPDGVFGYRVRTPWNLLASAAYIVGQHGLVSIDYGYTDFRQARLRPNFDFMEDYDFQMENDAIRDGFRNTHSVRVGTEWRSGAWYFRGGWGIWPDAYADRDPRHGTSYMRFTGGVGYRTEHLSIDFTGLYGTRNAKYFQYDPGLVDATSVKLTDTRGMITVAFRP